MELYFNSKYPGYFACGVSILYRKNLAPVVVLTHLEENYLSPLQNFFEGFVTEIYSERFSHIDPEAIAWIEHRPPYLSIDDEDEFDQISLTWTGERSFFSRRWKGSYADPKWGAPDDGVLDIVAERLELHSDRSAWQPGSCRQDSSDDVKMWVIEFIGISVSLNEKELRSLKSAIHDIENQCSEGSCVMKHLISASAEILRKKDSGWHSVVRMFDRNVYGFKHQAVYWEFPAADIGCIIEKIDHALCSKEESDKNKQ